MVGRGIVIHWLVSFPTQWAFSIFTGINNTQYNVGINLVTPSILFSQYYCVVCICIMWIPLLVAVWLGLKFLFTDWFLFPYNGPVPSLQGSTTRGIIVVINFITSCILFSQSCCVVYHMDKCIMWIPLFINNNGIHWFSVSCKFEDMANSINCTIIHS